MSLWPLALWLPSCFLRRFFCIGFFDGIFLPFRIFIFQSFSPLLLSFLLKCWHSPEFALCFFPGWPHPNLAQWFPDLLLSLPWGRIDRAEFQHLFTSNEIIGPGTAESNSGHWDQKRGGKKTFGASWWKYITSPVWLKFELESDQTSKFDYQFTEI